VPTNSYKEYVEVAKQLFKLGKLDKIIGLKIINSLNKNSSTRYTRINNEYVVNTTFSKEAKDNNLAKMKKEV